MSNDTSEIVLTEIDELRVALQDAINLFDEADKAPDSKSTICTAERREAWVKALTIRGNDTVSTLKKERDEARRDWQLEHNVFTALYERLVIVATGRSGVYTNEGLVQLVEQLVKEKNTWEKTFDAAEQRANDLAAKCAKLEACCAEWRRFVRDAVLRKDPDGR